MLKLKTVVFSILMLCTVLPACAPRPEGTGVLVGHVTIGPLVPVQRIGEPDPTPAPEVYAARQIVVYSEDGETEIVRVQIGADGNYRTELTPGKYMIDINRLGIDSAAGLPTTVQINLVETTRMDIDIDTGIR